MSSRIIRGDGRFQTSKISSPTGEVGAGGSQDHIMDVEKQAFEQGYAEGERIGKQMGEAMVESICKRYEKSLADLAASHKQMVQAMEEQTVQLALEIGRKIVQRELTMDRDLVAALAAVALKRLSGHQSIGLRVSRHDLERVRGAIANVNSAVTVKEDPALERGDYVIETGQTHLDGRVSSQIDTIGRALLDEGGQI
jgi:flagellar biosynthesis/type III secretory pathway protein FliH